MPRRRPTRLRASPGRSGSSPMAATSKKKKGPVANGIELVVTVAIAIGLALLIQAFLVKPYRIPSGSMIPTLQIGQRILVNRLDTSPGVGSIVVFHPPAGADPNEPVCGNPAQGSGKSQPCNVPTPAESKQTFVKRVVGLPGDHLRSLTGRSGATVSRRRAPTSSPARTVRTARSRSPSRFQPITTT